MNYSGTKTKPQSLRDFRIPATLWLVTLSFIAFYILRSSQSMNPLSPNQAQSIADNSSLVQSGILIGGLLIEVGIVWVADWLVRIHPLVLIVAQLALGISTTLSFTGDMPVFIIGLLPLIAIEILHLYANPRRMLTVLGVLYFGGWIVYLLANGLLQGIVVLQSIVFMVLVFFYYWRMYSRQVAERNRAQDLLSELKIAYAQVEESTKRTERQRVARELHDTLTQGLAGTVLQLEAAKKFLAKGDVDRTATVIDSTINISRETLRESRLTLTDLRSTNEESLSGRINLLLDAFKKNYGLHVTVHLDDVPHYANAQLTEITRILSEALINVVKHTDGKEAVIQANTKDDIFTIKVIDFGDSTVTKPIPVTAKKGHFGLQGMHERAAALDGALTVVTIPDEGTTVTLRMPTTRKEQL